PSGAATPSASATSSGGGQLAETGADPLLPAAAGAGLLVLGGTVLTTRKQTRRHLAAISTVRPRGGRTAVALGLTALLDRIPTGPVSPLGSQNNEATRV